LELFLTLDIGTTSIKVGVVDLFGKIIAFSTQEYALLTPKKGWVELNPETYWCNCLLGIRDVLSQLNKAGISSDNILSISVCSQGETVIFLDKSGNPLQNAIVWLDTRAKKEAEELNDRFGEISCTGQSEIDPILTAPKILWFKKHREELFKKIHKVVLVGDYILYRLTGEFIGDFSLYSTTALLDIRERKWFMPMLNTLELPVSKLVTLVESGEIIGPLTASVIDELNFSDSILAVSGGMDQTLAMVGAGNIESGIVTETTGAALALCSTLESYSSNLRLSVQPHAVPGKYLITGWLPSGGMSLKWARNTLFSTEWEKWEIDGENPYDKMTMAEEFPEPGSGGLFFYPFMSGSGPVPVDSSARGIWYGLELHHSRKHLISSIMEGLAFITKYILSDIEMECGPSEELRVMGGGAYNSRWNQMKADITGRKVNVLSSVETATVGTAILQSVSLKKYNSIEEAADQMVNFQESYYPVNLSAPYQEIYQEYIEIMKLFSNREEIIEKV